MAIDISRRHFTVNEFARMLETGILAEDERVELIDGEVCEMSPVGSHHAACVKRLNAFLSRLLGTSALVSVQDPIRLSDYSEPQPDIAILRPREDFYANAHPEVADILLVIEVSETSLDYDRTEKLPRYAQARIPEVWIIDLISETVIQYAQPDGRRYQSTSLIKRGQSLNSTTIQTLHIRAEEILG